MAATALYSSPCNSLHQPPCRSAPQRATRPFSNPRTDHPVGAANGRDSALLIALQFIAPTTL